MYHTHMISLQYVLQNVGLGNGRERPCQMYHTRMISLQYVL